MVTFGWRFFEKAALTALVTAIFARILPGATDNFVLVSTAAVVIVAASTLLSGVLARRGVAWRRIAVQFAVTLLANVATVVVLGVAVGVAVDAIAPRGGANCAHEELQELRGEAGPSPDHPKRASGSQREKRTRGVLGAS